jgi:hypothetical protein
MISQNADPGGLVSSAAQTCTAVSKRMSATLRDPGFAIDPPPTEVRPVAVTETAPTDWNWQVTPKQTGVLLLSLTIDAYFVVDGQNVPRSYRVFSRSISVTASLPQRGLQLVEWARDHWVLLTTLVAAIGAVIRWLMGRNRWRL